MNLGQMNGKIDFSHRAEIVIVIVILNLKFLRVIQVFVPVFKCLIEIERKGSERERVRMSVSVG